SPLRAPQDTSRSWVPNYMEFVSPADITRHDVTDFLAKAELPNYQETAKNAIQDVLDGDIKNLLNPEFDEYDNVASNLLAFLRYFFQGRKVTVGSKIQEQEDMNLGSYITKFGAFSDLDIENYDTRSEERRVGKECRYRGGPDHRKKKQKQTTEGGRVNR